MKGSVASIAGKRAAREAQALETLGASGSLEGAVELLARLYEETIVLRNELRKALAQASPAT